MQTWDQGVPDTQFRIVPALSRRGPAALMTFSAPVRSRSRAQSEARIQRQSLADLPRVLDMRGLIGLVVFRKDRVVVVSISNGTESEIAVDNFQNVDSLMMRKAGPKTHQTRS